jgi:hypothetical protein
MGAVDTLLNHEIIERLPQRPAARTEIGLHVIREANYALLFGGLGWFVWHGWAAAVIAVLLVVEVADTALDELVENRSRVLPQNERGLHLFLTLNLGAIIALLVPLLLAWSTYPSAILIAQRGVISWLLGALALTSAAWAARDLIAYVRLARLVRRERDSGTGIAVARTFPSQ